jgi:hypothetical protein
MIDESAGLNIFLYNIGKGEKGWAELDYQTAMIKIFALLQYAVHLQRSEFFFTLFSPTLPHPSTKLDSPQTLLITLQNEHLFLRPY